MSSKDGFSKIALLLNSQGGLASIIYQALKPKRRLTNPDKFLSNIRINQLHIALHDRVSLKHIIFRFIEYKFSVIDESNVVSNTVQIRRNMCREDNRIFRPASYPQADRAFPF